VTAATAGKVEYWDQVATRSWGGYITALEAHTIVQAQQAAPQPLHALDVGCGGGRWSRLLRDLGWSVTALDVDPDALAACADLNPGIDCRLVGPEDRQLPAEDASVSLVVCIEVREVAHSDWFLPEVRRVLRPGGQLVAVTWNRTSLRGQVADAVSRIRLSQPHAWYRTSYRSWRQQLRTAGLDVESERGLCWFPFTRTSDSRLVPVCVAIEERLGLSRLVTLSPWVLVTASKPLDGRLGPSSIAPRSTPLPERELLTTSPGGTPEGGNDRAVRVDRHTDPAPELLAAWDRLVASTPGTDVTQLSVWSRVRRSEGFRTEYVFAQRGGKLVGGAQILLRGVRGVARVGLVSYGPLIAEDVEERAEVVEGLARELARLPAVRMLFVQPAEGGEDIRQALQAQGFRPSSAGIAPTGSVRLDLTRSEDDIRRGLPPRLRSWIRRWPDHGVTVRRGDGEDIPVLASLMRAAATAHGYRSPSDKYLRHMYRELSATGNAALFIGEVHGRPVSADVVTMCGAMVRGRFGGFDRTGEGARLSVPGAVRWEIIRWAKQSGYRWLDFGGLSEQTLCDAVDRGIRMSGDWPGADQAKLRYGGVPFRYPAPVELIRPRPLRSVYETVARSEWGRATLHRLKVALRSRPSRRREGRADSTSTPGAQA
jgi:SAM-dependent methyltransferase